MKKVYIILLFVIYSSPGAQELAWDIIGEMRYPVAAGLTFANENIIYIIGGYSKDEQSSVNWIQKYDYSQSISKIISETYVPRTGHAGAEANGLFYYFGGIQDTTQDGNYIENWDFYTGYSGEIIDSHTTFNRINSSCEIVNGSMYIIGGNPYFANDTLNLSYIVEYNLSTGVFTEHNTTFNTLDDMPEQQMTAVLGDNIFIFGGLLNGITRDIYKFDTYTKTFSKLPARLLEPRAGGVAINYYGANEIIIIGGFNESASAMNTTEIFSYNESSISLKQGALLEKARAHNMAQFAGGDIYVLGGYGPGGEHVKEIEKLGVATSLTDEGNSPEKFSLDQNYPNPFNPSTKIEFNLATQGNVSLKVYDLSGSLVKSLIDDKLSAGKHIVSFSTEDKQIASGVYIYRLTTDKFTTSRKMLLLK